MEVNTKAYNNIPILFFTLECLINVLGGRNVQGGKILKNYLISVLVRINVLGGKIWKITVTPDQNFKQSKFFKTFTLISFT